MAPRRHTNGHVAVILENAVAAAAAAGGNMIHEALDNNNPLGQLANTSTTRCCTPTGECLRGDAPIRLNALQDVVKVTCNNESCPVGQFMHRECFDAWEQTVLTYLKSCGRARSWSERQRHQNLWTKKGYDLAFKACGCRCGRGHLKKDLDWMPQGAGNIAGNRPDENEAKKKKRRNRQNTRPSLAVSAGPPNHGNHANGRGASEAQIIESGRGRAGSLSSSTGSSSPPATSEPSVSPLHQPQAIVKKKSKVDFFSDRARQSCGANGIFSRRLDFSAFNSLPRTKLNSYHIKRQILRSPELRLEIFRNKALLKTFAVACGLMFFQQFSGINAVIYYGAKMSESMPGRIDSLEQILIFALMQVLSSLVAAFLIDKAGRKILMIISESLMFLSLAVLAISFALKPPRYEDAGSLRWLSSFSMCCYFFFYSLGAGPIPWLYTSEIFPARLRSTALCVASFFNWILAFLITCFFEEIVEIVGITALFFCFAVICLLAVIFVTFCMIETKGKSFREIQEEFGIFEIENL